MPICWRYNKIFFFQIPCPSLAAEAKILDKKYDLMKALEEKSEDHLFLLKLKFIFRVICLLQKLWKST